MGVGKWLCASKKKAPRVKIKTYEYDPNGNQTKVSQTTCNTPNATVLRKNLWDEENRLRAIDLNPEATNVHPIAIYTYDAGGERIIKHNSTNVAIYENALKVGEKNQPDFMIYPSGMLVFRPSFGGDGGGSYTKHYFAGTQRVSSKIGTTTNLGKFLEEWQQQEQSSPSYPAITTQAQMDNANTGATKVFGLKGFNFTNPPIITGGNTSLIAIPAFTHSTANEGKETEHYFFHPDHLGSSNYITNFVGEVSQHSEYFAFGETFIEEHKNSHNSPYKFNGKELDEESGLYYYGARYYDPRISIWASVDPLVEKTMSAYGYCNLNPVNLIDPTGMEAVPGDDTYIYKDAQGKVTKTEVINTGTDTPNRLFVQDTSATKDTENRKEHNGSFFQIEMIPSNQYTESDYKSEFFGSSQFDKDRHAYITNGGDYSDKNYFQRLDTSIADDPVTIEDLKVVFSRKNSSTNTTLGIRKGERGFSGKPSGTNNPYKHIKPDPSKPGNVIYKHPQTGKKISRPATPDEKGHFGL